MQPIELKIQTNGCFDIYLRENQFNELIDFAN